MFSRLYCQEALKNVHVGRPKSTAVLFVFAKKFVAHAVVGRVALVNATIGFALAFRAVGGVVARGDTRDEHGRLAAVSGAGGEQAKGKDTGEK